MFKLLPNRTGKKGFTLIELLVVISILAVLAVIGLTVYSGVQKNARDSRRKADIDSIAQAMETNYSDTTGQYIALAAAQFSSVTVPTDPQVGQATACSGLICIYCSSPAGANCAGTDTAVAVGVPAAGATYKVCANLENGGSYCRSNQR